MIHLRGTKPHTNTDQQMFALATWMRIDEDDLLNQLDLHEENEHHWTVRHLGSTEKTGEPNDK